MTERDTLIQTAYDLALENTPVKGFSTTSHWVSPRLFPENPKEVEGDLIPLPQSLNPNLAGSLVLTQLQCCGITEIAGLLIEDRNANREDYPRNTLRDVMLRKRPEKGGYLMFTQAVRHREMSVGAYGELLKDYIIAQGLGEVHVAPTVFNNNSGNFVTVYLWRPDGKACRAWFAKNFGDDALKFYGGNIPSNVLGTRSVIAYWQTEADLTRGYVYFGTPECTTPSTVATAA